MTRHFQLGDKVRIVSADTIDVGIVSSTVYPIDGSIGQITVSKEEWVNNRQIEIGEYPDWQLELLEEAKPSPLILQEDVSEIVFPIKAGSQIVFEGNTTPIPITYTLKIYVPSEEPTDSPKIIDHARNERIIHALTSLETYPIIEFALNEKLITENEVKERMDYGLAWWRDEICHLLSKENKE